MRSIQFLKLWSSCGALALAISALPAHAENDWVRVFGGGDKVPTLQPDTDWMMMFPSDRKLLDKVPDDNNLSSSEQRMLRQWQKEPEIYKQATFKTSFKKDALQNDLRSDLKKSAEVSEMRSAPMIPSEKVHFDETKAKAKAGDVNAQLELGSLYDLGEGVIADHQEAVNWWLKAAQKGNAAAQNNLGAAYATGSGVARDQAKSAEWYHKAADQGSPPAQAELGWMYFSGRGVAKDKDKAKELWVKAAPDSAKAKFGLHVLSNTRKLTGDGDDAVTGCIMGISLDGTFPDQILYVGEDGVLCSQLKLADAAKSVQEEYGYSPERAAAYRADRVARQRTASEARVKELETVLRRLTALRRERQIDDLNDNLRFLTETLDARNPVPHGADISMKDLDQKIFDLQQSIDQMTEEPVRVSGK